MDINLVGLFNVSISVLRLYTDIEEERVPQTLEIFRSTHFFVQEEFFDGQPTSYVLHGSTCNNTWILPHPKAQRQAHYFFEPSRQTEVGVDVGGGGGAFMHILMIFTT